MSLKFSLFNDSFEEIAKGIFERIGSSNSFCDFKKDGNKTRDEKFFETHKDSLVFLFEKFRENNIDPNDIEIIGHRVAHGGKNNDSILVEGDVIENIKKISNLAPLHNPVQISVVESCMELFPNIKNSLSFDTAFHQTMPEVAYTYGIPVELTEKYSIRRYGFHGLSHEFVLNEYARMINKDIKDLNLIVCHLGSGASVCAIKNGKSVDTSMGFTPLEGLLMGTRAGDLDPSIPLFLARNKGMSLDDVENILNKKSGLIGLTGMQNVDMREILYLADYPVTDFDGSYLNEKFTSEDLILLKKRCKLAVDIFVYKVKKYIGSYYFILGNVDAIIFTAGIGERSQTIRDLVIKDLPIGNTAVEVINTNEEKMIAMEANNFIK